MIKSLMCGVYGIENRKNSHEMFGYDFMVDTNYKVWLLEVNSSPSMDYSTVYFCFIFSISPLNWSRKSYKTRLSSLLTMPMHPRRKKRKLTPENLRKSIKELKCLKSLPLPGLTLL